MHIFFLILFSSSFYPNLFFTFQFSFMWVREKRKNNRILSKRSHTQNLEDSLNHHIPIHVKVIESEKVNHKNSPQNKSSLCDYNIFQYKKIITGVLEHVIQSTSISRARHLSTSTTSKEKIQSLFLST